MTQINKAQVVLITGSNSGIGAAITQQAVAAGYTTYGGARRAEAFKSVEALGAIPIALDICDEQSMRSAVELIVGKHGKIDVLVNNAGYGHLGPIEEIKPDEWRQQFETNVFGLVRMAQLVIPSMRAQRLGRIINISSAGGEFTFPLAGAYHASKYAVESITDAMRFELKPFGIKVVSIQPGPVSTPLAAAAAESIQAEPDSPYFAIVQAFRRLSRQSLGYLRPEQVARVVIKAMRDRRPSARYKIGMTAHMMPALHSILSTSMWDLLIARFYS